MSIARAIGFVIALAIATFGVSAADKGEFALTPVANAGTKWRVGYYEGGEYIDYQKTLMETVRGLMKLGWIETAEIPAQKGEQTAELWQWLSTKARSDYLEFVPDAHYSADWNDDGRAGMVEKILTRLNDKKDLNLLIAMGTWAGKDMASDRHTTSTVVLSSSDPLSAGIIRSVEDSGFAHVHATVDPYKFDRQIRVFHEIIGFKKLGIAYENTVNGRSYAALDVVDKVREERGFDVVPCHTQSDIADTKIAEDSVLECFRKLADQVDAIYVTQQGGVNPRSIPALVKTANEFHIPTFSQSGSEEVKYGFLASLSQAGFKYVGEFHAKTIAKIFNGASPNQLDQLFEEPPKIALNLKTAEIIGFDPPVILLGAADELFTDIAKPQ
ncbi:MAG: ABC transporter substrate-binding protein [Ectothiorhodospiraceae bacterium]|nr:ABC transporter substrate-binding protein [Chromatiales bacterium]MCP5154562.1 ABC transporter substrate-binding protein [Ectothiorhodospiraceae bacterium]